MVARVPLTKGLEAIVDDADADRVLAFRWQARLYPSDRRYASRGVRDGKRITHVWMHRFILDAPPGLLVDHINGDGLDNRRANLRLCSKTENNRNRRSARTGFKGVSKVYRKYHAALKCGANRVFIGIYDTEIEAATAYDRAAKQWFGEFARLNFPDGMNVLAGHHGQDIAVGSPQCTEARCIYPKGVDE